MTGIVSKRRRIRYRVIAYDCQLPVSSFQSSVISSPCHLPASVPLEQEPMRMSDDYIQILVCSRERLSENWKLWRIRVLRAENSQLAASFNPQSPHHFR